MPGIEEKPENYTSSLNDEIEMLSDEIVKLEWEAFDKVKNECGRAACQDDFYTFRIMRKSQYLTWNKELLLSYIQDFMAANAAGWNLITEKYGRMMESTAPTEWEKIKDKFPEIDDDKKAIIEAIVALRVGWMEEFAEMYPKVAGNARSIHTADDLGYNTSYETYLRGEISTYSDETLKLYGAFIAETAKSGQNLATLIMTNTVGMYGYKSLSELESKL